jgi:glycosyltransferase involved in cell wall biosynthesis
LSAPKNICFFNTTKFWGGGEKWHFEAAEMMSKTENNTFFICDGGGEIAKKLANIDVVQFYITAGNLSFLNASKVDKLIQFYQENKIDAVIFNSPKDLKLGGKAAQKAGVKTRVYRRGIAVEVKKKRLTANLFKNVVTHFIFNSKATKELLQKNYAAIIPTKKSTIIYNAIEFPNSPATQNSPSTNQVTIGNAGRLVEQKGQHYLIDIANKLQEKGVDFRILIAGDGRLFDELKTQIQKEKLTDKVELLGFVKDMNSFMAQIDIFVSTALWEGFGFVLAEAMVAKKPVLAFNLSSNPELVKDGENGFLIPPENTGLFAEKLELLINDSSLRKQLGENAYTFAKTNFEKEKQFQKLIDFIK